MPFQRIAQHAAGHTACAAPAKPGDNPASAISAILERLEYAVLLGGLIQAE
jgi:hypothetical protein